MMIRITAIWALAIAGLLAAGCASGGGTQVVKGAARGATHGVIEDVGKTNTGKGAAHGALGAAYQVRDQNKTAGE